MTVPEKGALVEVTLHGEVVPAAGVTGIETESDGFWLRLNDHILNWVPAGASWTVLSPPRPNEVLLLDCGHVVNEPRPSSTVGTVYCWRSPCHRMREVAQVGRVNW